MPRKSSISEPYIHAPAPAKAKAAPAKTPIKAAVKVFAPEDPAPPPLTSKAKSALYETTLQSLRKALGSSETRVARYADKTLEALTKQHIVRFTAKSNLPPKHVTTLEELLDLMPGKKAESTVKEKEERSNLMDSRDLLRYLSSQAKSNIRNGKIEKPKKKGRPPKEQQKPLKILESDGESDYSEGEPVPMVPPKPNQGKKRGRVKKDKDKDNSDSEASHQNTCAVCTAGGELILCDTCSLVFHLECIRPPQKCVPRGQWNCAWCVSNGVGIGHVKRNRVDQVRKLAVKACREMDATKIEADEKSGRSVRSEPPKEITTGEPSSAEELATTMDKEASADGEPRRGSLDSADGRTSGRKRKAPVNFDPQDGPASHWGRKMEATPPPVEVHCDLCRDSKSVRVCMECACRVCYSKHDAANVVLCDGCDQEYHTYCLVPAIKLPSDDSEWHCPNCRKDEDEDEEEDEGPLKPTRTRKKKPPSAKVAPVSTMPVKSSRSGRAIKATANKDLGYEPDEPDQMMHHPARPRGAQHSDDHHAGPAGGKTGRIRKTKSYDDYYEEDELTANPYAFGAGTGAAPPGVVAPQSHVPSPLQTAYASAGLPNHSPIANGARKPGGRECMHLLRKSGGHPLNESNLSQIVDYAFRGKVEQVAILRDSIGLLHDTIIDLFAKEIPGGVAAAQAAVEKAMIIEAAREKAALEKLALNPPVSAPAPNPAPAAAGLAPVAPAPEVELAEKLFPPTITFAPSPQAASVPVQTTDTTAPMDTNVQ